MQSQTRVTVCAVVAPLLGGLAVLPLVGGDNATCATIIAFAVNVVVGLPVSVFLFSEGTPLWRVAAAGFAVGAAPFVFINGYFLLTEWTYVRIADSSVALRWTVAGAICGSVTATSFWLMVGRHFHSQAGEA